MATEAQAATPAPTAMAMFGEDHLMLAINAFRTEVINGGMDQQAMKAWPPARLARECYGHSKIRPLRQKLFPGEPVNREAPFSETNHPGFVQFCQRRFPSEIVEAEAVALRRSR
jgi:hypothetical protein